MMSKPVNEHVVVQECPFCHATGGKVDNQWKLYILNRNGCFKCFRCSSQVLRCTAITSTAITITSSHCFLTLSAPPLSVSTLESLDSRALSEPQRLPLQRSQSTDNPFSPLCPQTWCVQGSWFDFKNRIQGKNGKASISVAPLIPAKSAPAAPTTVLRAPEVHAEHVKNRLGNEEAMYYLTQER